MFYSLTLSSIHQVHLESILTSPLKFSFEERMILFLTLDTKYHIIYKQTKLYIVIHVIHVPHAYMIKFSLEILKMEGTTVWCFTYYN